MGKITGFLEFERNDRDYAPVEERIRHWREFVLPMPEPETRRQAARCMNCGIPYCHTGCPVNNQIPDWNDLVYTGAWQEAARNLYSTNNFPEVTGRLPRAGSNPNHRRSKPASASPSLDPAPPGLPAPNNSRAPAMTCMCTSATPRRVVCC